MISPSLHLDPEDRSGSSSSPSSWGSRDPARSQVSGVLWVAEHWPRGEETGSTGGPRPYAAEGRELSSQPAGPLPGRAAFPSQSSVALRSHSTTRTRLKSLHAAPRPLALPSEYPGSPSIYRPPDPETEPLLPSPSPHPGSLHLWFPHNGPAVWSLLTTHGTPCPQGRIAGLSS